jgi:hypothetical protein
VFSSKVIKSLSTSLPTFSSKEFEYIVIMISIMNV